MTVVDTATHTVIDLNPATPTIDRIPVGNNPAIIAFSPDGSLAYVLNGGSGTLSVIDTATHTVIDLNPATPTIDSIPVGSFPSGLALSPDGSFAYVTNQFTNAMTVIALVPTTPPSVLP